MSRIHDILNYYDSVDVIGSAASAQMTTAAEAAYVAKSQSSAASTLNASGTNLWDGSTKKH